MEYDDPNLFQGIRFYLSGFNSVIHDQVKSQLLSYGGVYLADYSPDCTHVIVHDIIFDDPICVAARRDGKTLVTSLWIDHSFNAGELANVSSIMYRPPKELNGIPGAKAFFICLTGYERYMREDVMTMAELMGAEFCKKLVPAKATHLICYKFEGPKYEGAKKLPRVKLVNHRWLEDCLKAWKILPEELYSKSSYELEMMEGVVKDSEDESGDVTTTLDRRGNGILTVQNKSGNGLDNSVITNNVSTPSSHRCPNNVRKDEATLPFKHVEHLPEQNARKTPVKSGHPLHVGEELGNISGPSSKRSADSLTDYSNPLKSIRTAKKSNKSKGKSGSSTRKKEHLESDEVWASNVEVDKVTVTSASVAGSNSKESSEVHTGKYSPSSLRRSSILLQPAARLSTPEGMLKHSADKVIENVGGRNIEPDKILSFSGSKRIDALEPEISASSPLKRSKTGSLSISNHKGTETARASEDKSSIDVPSRSLAFEKLEVGKADNMDVRTSSVSGNVVSSASSGVKNKKAEPHILPEYASFSPELKKLEALKSGNSMLNSDDPTGSSAPRPPRRKTVARKTLGSRPKVSKKTADALKGSLGEKNYNDDAALHLTGQIRGKDNANQSVGEKIMAAHTVDGSNALKFSPLRNSTANINDYADPVNDDTNGLPEFVVQLQNSKTVLPHVTKSRARETSGVLHYEIDDPGMMDSPLANTYKQGTEHEKQNLVQKNGISGLGKGKTAINAPKDVVKDADVGGKASEEKGSVKGQTVAAAGKKRRGDQLVKGPVEVDTNTVASDDCGASSGGKQLGNIALKMRCATLSLNMSDTPVEVDKETESALDENGQHNVDKQPENLSSTPNLSDVLLENGNESASFAVNGRCIKNDVQHTGKKRGGNSEGLISSGKENLPFPGGKPGKLSGKSNDSDVRKAQGSIKAKKISGKKRRRTVVLNEAEEPVESEKENEPFLHDNEVGSNGISSDPLSIQSGSRAVKNEPAWFLVSGHRLQRKEFHQLIKRLKGKHCRDSHQWSYQATHFIVPDPIRRTEKFFAAAASGRWILKTDYLAASIQAGKFLPEEPYEWHKTGLSEDGAINLEAPRRWRLVREKTGHGAFYGMRIVVYGECIAPPLDTLKRVVKAGDGTILATSPPYTRFLNSGVDFAIVSPGMPRVDIWVQEFLRHEIPCISADYLVEYVCKPSYPLDKHVQYNTHEWAAKSFERLTSLSIESVADAATPENQVSEDLACQVCGHSDRADVMLICGDESGSTGCGVGTHIDCCDPPFENVPEEDWFCPKCIASTTKKMVSK